MGGGGIPARREVRAGRPAALSSITGAGGGLEMRLQKSGVAAQAGFDLHGNLASVSHCPLRAFEGTGHEGEALLEIDAITTDRPDALRRELLETALAA